eukprot:GEMP01011784.1.p1 GENE.GEMP01011784.1~~GEMP01011784.1.p1  ORF type:complete len:693 (+),score=130.56 GEMP01011784.1:140-2218(+)
MISWHHAFLHCRSFCRARSSTWQDALKALRDAKNSTPLPPTTTLKRRYQDALNACARAQIWSSVPDLVAAMEQDTLKPTTVDYNMALNAYAKMHRWQQALSVLRTMHAPPSEVSYGAVVSACAKSGAWQQACALLDEMRHDNGSSTNTRVNVITYNAAMSACVHAGKWQRALSLFNAIDIPTIVSYNTMIRAYGQGNQWHMACSLLTAMAQHDNSIAPTVTSFNAAISACAQGRNWQQALAVLAQMRDVAIAPDVVSFNACITACEKAGNWEHALRLVLSMQQGDQIAPDIVTYSAAISACERAAKWQRALDFLSQMCRANIRGTTIAYNACISACAKAAQWQQALQLLSYMNSQLDAAVAPDLISFNACMSACGKGGAWKWALHLLDQLRTSNNLSPDVISFNTCMSACEKIAEWPSALALMDVMVQSNIHPDVISYNACISSCARAHEWQRALTLLDRMQHAHQLAPTVVSLNACITACVGTSPENNNWQRALAIFDRMQQGYYSNVIPDDISYNALMAALGTSKCRWEHALELFYAMPSSTMVSIRTIIDALTYCGQSTQATNVYRKLSEMGKINHWKHKSDAASCAIDLHEFPLSVAKCAVRMVMEDFRVTSPSCMQYPRKRMHLLIICGRGAHSAGTNGPTLKPAIARMCEEEFFPPLEVSVREDDPGVIRVPFESIEKWVSAQQIS